MTYEERSAMLDRIGPLAHDPFECPDPSGDHCEDARRRAIVRAGVRIPGLTPKHEDDPDYIPVATGPHPGDFGLLAGEPLPLVEQSNRAEAAYLQGSD